MSICLLFLAGCGGHSGLAPVGNSGKQLKSSKRVSSNARFHTVRKGETLYSIAFQHGKDYRKLAHWNGIKRPYTIYIGQKIALKGHKKPVSHHKLTKKTNKQAETSRKSTENRKKTTKTVKRTPKQAHSSYVKGPIKWKWPTRGKLLQTYLKKDPTRKGIELGGRLGQPVIATDAGKVVYSGSGLRGYGKLIIVKHNERFLSAYAHNRKLLVKEGSQVKRGQRIAEMGRSGTDKVKLHFEIRRDGKPVDPLRYLPKR